MGLRPITSFMLATMTRLVMYRQPYDIEKVMHRVKLMCRRKKIEESIVNRKTVTDKSSVRDK